MSARFESALAEWRECREAYDLALYAAFNAAEEATSGALLNDRGKARGVDPISLFMGPAVRAYAYASPELVEWWAKHPRVTFERFEAQWPYVLEEDGESA